MAAKWGKLSASAYLRWRRLRWLTTLRKGGIEPINLVLGQTFLLAAVLSVLSISVDWLTSEGRFAPVLAAKLSITVGFFASAALARLQKRRASVVVSLLVTVWALAFGAWGFGPTAHGFFQLSAMLLLPFLVAVATLGDLAFAVMGGVTVLVSSQMVDHLWKLPLAERVLSFFLCALATLVAMSVAAVLNESKRQALHDQRLSARVNRRLALAQRQRAEGERLAVVGQLASTMAHEINNPLAFTMANVRFVLDALAANAPPTEPGELRGALQESQDGLKRIQAIVERMSSFRVPTAPQGATLDVRRALHTFVASFELSQGLSQRIIIDAGPELPPVGLDELRLGRVLQAVLTNALDAAGDGEKVVTITPQVVDQRLHLTVDDNGPGIDESVLPRLFEPFVAQPGSGKLGLSLALARELMRSVGGDLRAFNRPGGGARVVVELPVGAPRRADGGTADAV
jgi:two-component system, NtrC family, sensor kinase